MKWHSISRLAWLATVLVITTSTITKAQVGLRWQEPVAAAFKMKSDRSLVHQPDEQALPLRAAMLNPAYKYENLAFFCRLEVKIEQKLRFPLKFRLGDVAYVDWLEGKRKY